MTHRVIIIDDNSAASEEHDASKPETTVRIPIPHDMTPKQVGDMVEKTLKTLEVISGRP